MASEERLRDDFGETEWMVSFRRNVRKWSRLGRVTSLLLHFQGYLHHDEDCTDDDTLGTAAEDSV